MKANNNSKQAAPYDKRLKEMRFTPEETSHIISALKATFSGHLKDLNAEIEKHEQVKKALQKQLEELDPDKAAQKAATGAVAKVVVRSVVSHALLGGLLPLGPSVGDAKEEVKNGILLQQAKLTTYIGFADESIAA